VQNQKAVMEFLLINHPLDCPVCDQSGECFLQDYSYDYGRGVSRFEEDKVKQPKKDLGPHVYLYSDRCIMCTRCVRFTREVTGTAELLVEGRGNAEQIDVFPGIPLDNELSANVIDLCPVGALLDKDFLFTQRVWFLKTTPSIDGITASGDNITIEYNEGKIYRLKPRTNHDVNKWWISDEIRYGWKFVHREDRLKAPTHVRFGRRAECDYARAYDEALDAMKGSVGGAGLQPATSKKHLALMVSPMLACEEAYLLARAARAIDPDTVFAVGPIPRSGTDKAFPGGYTVYAEKAPNARGVRRVLEAMSNGKAVLSFDELAAWIKKGPAGDLGALILTGNYPSDWVTADFAAALKANPAVFTLLIDTLPSALSESAAIVLPGATFAEKAGTFENAKGRLQAFEQAIPVNEGARTEGQIALDLLARAAGVSKPERYNAGNARREMAAEFPSLVVFETQVHYPAVEIKQEPEVALIEL
ncbi:MAG: molybdopterin-dependent oxidoreductase, partial [Phycisphaerales bacterium]